MPEDNFHIICISHAFSNRLFPAQNTQTDARTQSRVPFLRARVVLTENPPRTCDESLRVFIHERGCSLTKALAKYANPQSDRPMWPGLRYSADDPVLC